jgi:CheY-like chemotaxis protein
VSVLLVEDNAMNQQMAKFSIIKCGATLEIAGHGQYAVNFVKERLQR